MTVFILKMIAMASMILDHIKYVIPETKCFATEYLGRIAFPIFAFLIAEGFVHTHSRAKYMLRMLIFAIISQIPFYIFTHNFVHSRSNFNIMFTFEIALVGLWIIDFLRNYDGISKVLNYIVMFAGLMLIIALTYFIHPDYTWYGVLTVWLFYLFRNSKLFTMLSFAILTTMYYISGGYLANLNLFFSMLIATLLPLVFIALYNGKQGRKLKYFFYIFYPAHFIILCMIGFWKGI